MLYMEIAFAININLIMFSIDIIYNIIKFKNLWILEQLFDEEIKI
jgi:hypothetical protein